MFTRVWRYLAIGAGAFVCAGVGAAFGNKINISWQSGPNIGPVEFTTIVLSALSVMLTVLTIFLAVLAFIGLSTINKRLEDHSKNYFDKNLKKGTAAFAMVEEVVREVLYSGVDPIDTVDNGETAQEEDGG